LFISNHDVVHELFSGPLWMDASLMKNHLNNFSIEKIGVPVWHL